MMMTGGRKGRAEAGDGNTRKDIPLSRPEVLGKEANNKGRNGWSEELPGS